MIRKSFLFLFFCILSSISLYASGVREIQDDPKNYVGKTVIVRAYVDSTVPIPFSDNAFFVLKDGDRRMPLLAPEQKELLGTRTSFRVKVLGLKRDDLRSSGEDAASSLTDFLLEKEIAGEKSAAAVSKAIIAVMDGIGFIGEGSYLLVAETE